MLQIQELLKDLSTQQKENEEKKDSDVNANFAYRVASREININIKVSNKFPFLNMAATVQAIHALL